MNPETKKKLVELGFTEDKPSYFTLSRGGYTINFYVKSEKFHEIWMTVPHSNVWKVMLSLADHSGAVEAGME